MASQKNDLTLSPQLAQLRVYIFSQAQHDVMRHVIQDDHLPTWFYLLLYSTKKGVLFSHKCVC